MRRVVTTKTSSPGDQAMVPAAPVGALFMTSCWARGPRSPRRRLSPCPGHAPHTEHRGEDNIHQYWDPGQADISCCEDNDGGRHRFLLLQLPTVKKMCIILNNTRIIRVRYSISICISYTWKVISCQLFFHHDLNNFNYAMLNSILILLSLYFQVNWIHIN